MLEFFDLFSLLLQLPIAEQLTWEDSGGEEKEIDLLIKLFI